MRADDVCHEASGSVVDAYLRVGVSAVDKECRGYWVRVDSHFVVCIHVVDAAEVCEVLKVEVVEESRQSGFHGVAHGYIYLLSGIFAEVHGVVLPRFLVEVRHCGCRHYRCEA